MQLGVRSMPSAQLLTEQLPLCAVSLVTAELFYKFHSFTLEFFAFAATWYLLAAAQAKLRRKKSRKNSEAA